MLDFFVDSNVTDTTNLIDTSHANSGTQNVDFGSGKVASLFGVINNNLSTELVENTSAIFQFNVKGIKFILNVFLQLHCYFSLYE